LIIGLTQKLRIFIIIMKILFKNNTTVAIRQLYKRTGELVTPLRQASALQRNNLAKYTSISQTIIPKKILTKRLIPTIVTYPVPGENTVNDITYIEPESDINKGLVRINRVQYFENVPPQVWNFCVGNYCVCQRWLKVREGTTLDHQSIQDYQRLVMLISETIDLMNNLDSQLIGNS
jgi:hypothetical protein